MSVRSSAVKSSRIRNRGVQSLVLSVFIFLVVTCVLAGLWRWHSNNKQISADVLTLETMNAAEAESFQDQLLRNWESTGPVIRYMSRDGSVPAKVRWRCREMVAMQSKDPAVAVSANTRRHIRLLLDQPTFLERERSQDQILSAWMRMGEETHVVAFDPHVDPAIRLRCLEMVQLKSGKPAAVAIASYSRGIRNYRAAQLELHPDPSHDPRMVRDDGYQLQTPCDVPLGEPRQEAFLRARQSLKHAQEVYEWLMERTGPVESAHAEERARRASRLYLACVKFTPLNLYPGKKP